MSKHIWDVIIVGGGSAGLSAALTLGRCRRSVLVCDVGQPRNRASKSMHCFISRDGANPAEFLRMAREQLRSYASVQVREALVLDIKRHNDGFHVELHDGQTEICRKLLLATGVVDHLPPIAGVEQFYGISVHHCPYCDGWETRNQAIAVYGKRRRGFEMARAMTAWTRDIVLCTDGAARLSATQRTHLQRNGISIVQERIERLDGTGGKLREIVFRTGRRLKRSALFFDTPSSGQSKLAQALGCQFAGHGGVKCGQYEATTVPGVFVAGNIIKDVQLVIVAAAEGTRAGFGINRALTREDFERRATGSRRIEHPSLEDPDMQRRRRKHA